MKNTIPVKKKWWASTEITPDLHRDVSLRQITLGLKKSQVMILLLELFAEGKLDALIAKRLAR